MKLGDEISQAQAAALYRTAAEILNLDFAPARRVVDSFARRVFDRPVEEMSPKQAAAIGRHIGAGDLGVHAGELYIEAVKGREERIEPMPAKLNGNGRKKLIEMNEDEFDRTVDRGPIGARKLGSELIAPAPRFPRPGATGCRNH